MTAAAAFIPFAAVAVLMLVLLLDDPGVRPAVARAGGLGLLLAIALTLAVLATAPGCAGPGAYNAYCQQYAGGCDTDESGGGPTAAEKRSRALLWSLSPR
jgi:hypothetical protein